MLGKGKGFHGFRSTYQRFFEVLVDQARYVVSDKRSRHHNGVDILRRLVDVLISFNTLAIVGIRDAVTEAALSIAKGVIDLCR